MSDKPAYQIPGKPKKKGRAPKHQNKTAFKHNPKSQTTLKIANIPNHGVCRKCKEIIEWRKQYRKYKPVSQPRKCITCHLPKIQFAYHVICKDCAKVANSCSKCCKTITEEDLVVDKNANDSAPVKLTQSELEEVLSTSTMKERQRRTLLRRWLDDSMSTAQVLSAIKRHENGVYAAEDDDDEMDDDNNTRVKFASSTTTILAPARNLKTPARKGDDIDDMDMDGEESYDEDDENDEQ